MTEKRFTIEYDGYMDNIIDNNSGKVVYPFDYVQPLCDLLNELHEENKKLKVKNRGLQSELEIRKADVDYANKISNELFDECKQYKKENEQLKQLVNIADDLIDKLGSETMQNEWIKNF